MQRQTLLRATGRLGIIYNHIITELGRQAGSTGIRYHGINGNRNNITVLNPRELLKNFSLVFDSWFTSEISVVLAEEMIKGAIYTISQGRGRKRRTNLLAGRDKEDSRSAKLRTAGQSL
jgi:hypothetical protein